MTDIQRAMLGDHEAAARLAEQGGVDTVDTWNTRAPILSAEEMEMLEGMG